MTNPPPTELAARIQQCLQLRNLNARKASLRVGDNPDLIRNILRGATRNPRADTLVKIAKALKVKEQWLIEGGAFDPDWRESPDGFPQEALPRDAAPAPPAAVLLPGRQKLVHAGGRRDLPVRGIAIGAVIDNFVGFKIGRQAEDYVDRPAALETSTAYALYVEGDSMDPAHPAGSMLVVAENRPALPGDSVVLDVDPYAGFPRQFYIKRLVSLSAEKIVVHQFNPKADLAFPRRLVRSIHHVMTVKDLLRG